MPKQQELAQFKQHQQDQVEFLLSNEQKANQIVKQTKRMNQVKVLNADGINHSNMLNASDHQIKKST